MGVGEAGGCTISGTGGTGDGSVRKYLVIATAAIMIRKIAAKARNRLLNEGHTNGPALLLTELARPGTTGAMEGDVGN